MQTLRRTVGVLIFPAIAYLGAACERTETPTEARPMAVVGTLATTTHWVNDDELTPVPPGMSCSDAGYKTISAAVVAASPGDIIMVCSGLYAEQVMITKTLTLLGAKAGVDARTRAFVPADEAIIDHPCGPVQIMADNVVLDGFTVQGSTLPDPCFLSGIWSNPGFSGTNGGHQILNNIVQNNISGIELDSNCPNPALVQRNLIQNNSNPGPGSGNGIQTNFGLCNATIDKNKFSGHLNSSVLLVATQSNLTISNNELVGGTQERIFLANTSASSITGNVSMGSTSSGTIRFFSGNSNVMVTGNTLLSGMRGIRVDDLDPFTTGANSGIEAHFNCIQGNSIAGLDVAAGDHTGTLRAENNWWGSSTGPTHPSNPGGTGDKIIDPDGNVTFIPFLTSPPGPPCPPPPPPPPSGKVTGGGQIDVPGGRGSFGFSAKSDGGVGSGHLSYMNHVSRTHLNCTVDGVLISGNTAELVGDCSSKSYTGRFMAKVEDNGNPGKGKDKFQITYGSNTDGSTVTPIRSGNIQIQQ